MKYLPQLLLATATALSLGSCAAPGGGGASEPESKLGPHSAQKFVMTSHLGARTLNENDITFARNLALVLTVKQTMVGNQQQIKATAAPRKDGPNGSPHDARGVQVRLIQPTQVASKLRTEPGAGELAVNATVNAQGGKYRTVVAEATINSPDYAPKTVTLTIPGDQ